jgi:sugar phosphate isomerase/epimerase
MSRIRIACQTYTWEMLGDEWTGTVDEILEAIAGAGYEGIEITAGMIGDYYDRPADFRRALQRRGLVLAAFAYASPRGFTDAAWRDQELAEAQRAARFAAEFPGAVFQLGGAASPNREQLGAKLDHAAGFYAEMARLGAALGLTVVFHPHSHHGSILESAEEYDHIFRATADSGLKWNPDTGHIVRGGQDLLACLRAHAGAIRHVHVKDVDAQGDWQPMGEGGCDFPAVLAVLAEGGYEGWVVAEEESAQARQDQVGAIAKNRQYLCRLGC